jgi:flagellar basal-body rod modification protein FlgD
MTSINTTDYSELGLRTSQENQREIKKELGQEEFLTLLTTQLANQDPLAPVDNKEFITQMSQFASLDSLQALENNFSELSSSLTSNQALQASALVGRNVLVEGNQTQLFSEGVIGGQLNLEQTTPNVRLEVKDASGQIVRTINLGTQQEGKVDFVWDGNNNDGQRMAEGNYSISAYGLIDGKAEQLNTSVVARVDSVSLGSGDGKILVNLSGIGQVNFSEVKEIG